MLSSSKIYYRGPLNMYPQVLGPINILQSGIVLPVVDTFGRCPFVTSSISSFDILNQSMDLTQSNPQSYFWWIWIGFSKWKNKNMQDEDILNALLLLYISGMRAPPQQHQLNMSMSRNPWKTLTQGYLPQLEIFTGSILSLPHSK